MDWNLFWTAFGAIGGTLGALATFLLQLLLHYGKLNYKKKVQLSFTDNITIVPGKRHTPPRPSNKKRGASPPLFYLNILLSVLVISFRPDFSFSIALSRS